ncbi:MAG: hypothetical protein B7Y39_03045 [Bdellovibrio sp. 28-41-41]|nr:MAG: hypothetical protein B7Y39_03045 [Bdellovibrio sp. 28-41-41]
MFSRLIWTRTVVTALTMLALSLSILSCGLKIGESPPAAAMPGYHTDSCFDAATTKFGEFFAGTAKDEEIEASWDCFSTMIKDFKSKVRCKIRDKCSPGEIAQFVEDNFMDENVGEVKQKVISAELQAQLMKVKKLFLGGNLEYINGAELDRLAELLGNLKGISKDINPSMKVLTLNWENKLRSSEVSLFDFEAVNENLIKIAQRFAGLVNKDDNVYHFDDFEGLITEMSRFVGSNWSWAGSVHNYLPMIKQLKKSINGGDQESLKDNEWNLFLLLGSRAYIQFLRYYYFIKDLDPEFTSLRLAYTARTIEETFQMIYDLLSYKESNQVSKSEIEDLLKSFSRLWPVLKTSPALITEAMKIKQVLIGGSEKGFEKDDFLRAQKKVNLIKQIVEKFTPYYQFYGLSWHPELLKQTEAFAYFAKATKSFEEMITKINEEFKFEKGYDFKSLMNLMAEIEKLYPGASTDMPLGKRVAQYACLAQLGSDVLLDKQDNQNNNACEVIELSSADLTKLVKKGGQVLTIFWDYYYFISRTKVVFNDLEWQMKLKDFGYKVITFLKSAIEERKSKRISNYEIKAVVNELSNIDIIPKSIKKTTIESLIQLAITKILVPEELKDKVARFDGFEPFHIEQLYREIDNYLGVNIYIHQAFENRINQKYDYKFLLGRFKQSIVDSTNPNFRLGMTEFVRNFETNYPMIVAADNRIFFNRNPSPIYDKHTLEAYNMHRFLAGLILRSYAKHDARTKAISSVLSDCEVKAIFLELKPILTDLDIISGSSGTSFIDARFIEANLFLPKSDGNDTVSFGELGEFVNYILSGFTIDDLAKAAIAKDCNSTTVGTDVLVDLACLRSSYKKNMLTVLNSMPSYVTYSQKENPTDWDNAFLNNLKAAGYKVRQDAKISLSEASLLPHILQYGETIFTKFDVNADGIIDKKEGIRAFPSFAFLLKRVARKQLENGDIKESELEAMFTYILKYGNIPECNKPFILLCLFDRGITNWLDWKSNYRKDDYTLSANRSQVSKILGIISDMVTTSPSVQEDTCKR